MTDVETKTISYLDQENAVLHQRVGKLEAERQDLERMLASERQEKWQWEHKAKERWALRRELEEAVGLADRETYDEEKFKAAVKRISELSSAVEAEREACAKVADQYAWHFEKDAHLKPENWQAAKTAKSIAALIRGRGET